jgi:hypothetical protein
MKVKSRIPRKIIRGRKFPDGGTMLPEVEVYGEKPMWKKLEDVGNDINDVGTGILTWGTGLRPPSDEEIQQGRGSWNDRTPLLTGAVTQGLMNEMAPALVQKGFSTIGPLIGDLSKAKNTGEALRRVMGIPVENTIPRMPMEDVKALRQVQEIGRLQATGTQMPERMKYALDNNLPEEHFQQLFNKSRSEGADYLKNIQDSTNPFKGASVIREPLGGNNIDRISQYVNNFDVDRLRNAMQNSGRRYVQHDEIFDDILRRSFTPQAGEGIMSHASSISNKDAIDQTASSALRGIDNLGRKIDNWIPNKLQDYPYYGGTVKQKVPLLTLSGEGNLKNVSKKVGDAAEGISRGDVFTGSTNTSHSSYLPQLKQVFKYKEGQPTFLGYRPMNSMGFLSQYGYDKGEISKYLNSEIDQQIKRGVIPDNIQRPFLKNDNVMLPHYGVKQYKYGGDMATKKQYGGDLPTIQWHGGDLYSLGGKKFFTGGAMMSFMHNNISDANTPVQNTDQPQQPQMYWGGGRMYDLGGREQFLPGQPGYLGDGNMQGISPVLPEAPQPGLQTSHALDNIKSSPGISMGQVNSGMGLANMALDTLGGHNSTTAGIKGAMSGAQAGMALGPWGAAAGAVLGGVSSVMGSNKQEEADRAAMIAKSNQALAAGTVNISPQAHIYDKGGSIGGIMPRLTQFNTGGSHEQNPNGGIPQGVAGKNGEPNLVEQGETKFNNYIFSDRLRLQDPKEYNLGGSLEGKTFSAISKKLSKSIEERPNDPIAKVGQDRSLERLKQANDDAIQMKQFEDQSQQMKCGGMMKTKKGKTFKYGGFIFNDY